MKFAASFIQFIQIPLGHDKSYLPKLNIKTQTQETEKQRFIIKTPLQSCDNFGFSDWISSDEFTAQLQFGLMRFFYCKNKVKMYLFDQM